MKIDRDAIDKKSIQVGECTSPAGHCYGGDAGGDARVQELSLDETALVEDAYYNKCQHCGKYEYVETKTEREKRAEKPQEVAEEISPI